MHLITALLAGTIFGAGLTIAQMVDPLKVLNFLDVVGIVKGTWDPTLLMVFVGALPTMFFAYRLRRLRTSTATLAAIDLMPRDRTVDARLLGGSAVFGLGWGLVGICPGPALASLAIAGGQIAGVATFVAAMLAGVLLSRLLAPSTPARPAGSPSART